MRLFGLLFLLFLLVGCQSLEFDQAVTKTSLHSAAKWFRLDGHLQIRHGLFRGDEMVGSVIRRTGDKAFDWIPVLPPSVATPSRFYQVISDVRFSNFVRTGDLRLPPEGIPSPYMIVEADDPYLYHVTVRAISELGLQSPVGALKKAARNLLGDVESPEKYEFVTGVRYYEIEIVRYIQQAQGAPLTTGMVLFEGLIWKPGQRRERHMLTVLDTLLLD